jgi:hypothetical protein
MASGLCSPFNRSRDVPEEGHVLRGGVSGGAAGTFLGLGVVLAEEAECGANGLGAFGGVEGNLVGNCGTDRLKQI